MSKNNIKILSWNVHYPTFAKNSGYVIEYLESQLPDVICLQEYVRGRDDNVVSWLNKHDFEYVYAPFAYDKNHELSHGILIAVRSNLSGTINTHELRNTSPRLLRNFPNNRVLLDANVTLANQKIHILNIHLTLPRPWTMDLRNVEFIELKKYINSLQAENIIMIGDFNFNIIDKRRRYLKRRYDLFTGTWFNKTWHWRGLKTPIAHNLDAAFWQSRDIQVCGILDRLLGYDHKPIILFANLNKENKPH